MKWCPHCRRYVKTQGERIEIRAIKGRFLIYHCSDCNGFIESERLSKEE